MFSFPECITWLVVGVTESVAIATINIITIIVLLKNRNLRKRSTYLVINLAVVDMFVAARATYDLFYWVGIDCNVWKYNLTEQWPSYVLYTFMQLFNVCSITNLAAISIERMNATLRPFSHRVIKKVVYGIIIAIVWVTAGLFSIALAVLLKFKGASFYIYLLNSYIVICLLVICISYSAIVIKVRYGTQPRSHGAGRGSRERKLTMTLFVVTVVSLLLYLPDNFYHFLDYATETFSSMSKAAKFRLHNILSVIFFANSLVNPILYVIRMPEYRSAVLALFRRRPRQQRQTEVLPLRNI